MSEYEFALGRELLKRASDIRQHADECRALAASMPFDEQREQLIAIAETWDRLADQQELSEERERPASLEPG